MHHIEPFFRWRDYYISEEDDCSPFYRTEYSEFEFNNTVYNYVIHPRWDRFGSNTLYLKILYADYKQGYSVIEMIGEWNDCLYNDIMFFKRKVIDMLLHNGVNKFILIGENVLNFHYDQDGSEYYDEWFQDVEDGWIAWINFREHVRTELCENNLDHYVNFGGELDDMAWRTLEPPILYAKVERVLQRRLSPGRF